MLNLMGQSNPWSSTLGQIGSLPVFDFCCWPLSPTSVIFVYYDPVFPILTLRRCLHYRNMMSSAELVKIFVCGIVMEEYLQNSTDVKKKVWKCISSSCRFSTRLGHTQINIDGRFPEQSNSVVYSYRGIDFGISFFMQISKISCWCVGTC